MNLIGCESTFLPAVLSELLLLLSSAPVLFALLPDEVQRLVSSSATYLSPFSVFQLLQNHVPNREGTVPKV